MEPQADADEQQRQQQQRQQQQDIRKQQGNTAFRAKRFPEAIEHYDAAVAIDPHAEAAAAIHSNLCAALLELDNPDRLGDALDHALRAAALRPQWHEAHYRRATALFKLHRFAESVAACEEALRLEPDAPETLALLQQVQGSAALPAAIDAAVADPAGLLASLQCVLTDDGDPAQLRRLLNLEREGERDFMRDRLLAHLARLKERVASFPRELLHAAAASDGDAAASQKLVDGICALALYTSEYPRGRHPLYSSVNAAMRIMCGSGEERFSRGDSGVICRGTQPFRAALAWILREVLPKFRDITFRGTGFELEQPRIGSTHRQHCFVSMSKQHDEARHFAGRTMMVLMTQSGASISFASMIPRESEVLLPPGIYLEVVARASATLLSVLHFEPGKKLLTLREVGMYPTPDELLKAVRAVQPVYEKFSRIYQMPSVAPRGELGGGAVGGAAGGGAAAGNNNNANNNNNPNATGNPNAVRLDAALDQNINNNDGSGSDMLIIAPGGTGKTTAAVFAQVHLSRQDAGRRLLPVFLPLSRLKQDDVTRQGGLDAALACALGCDTATLVEAAREFRVVAILDSLDETMVEDAHWAGLLERNPAAQQCRVIMTSRPTPLATQQHERIFGSARRVQVIDLLPLPQRNLNRIFAQLVEDDNAQLPAALLASDDATPLLAGFAATLVNKRVDISGITGQRELLELYLQHTCDLPRQALSTLCLRVLARGFHCTLGEAKLAAEAADVASRVPCRVEDEFDDGADFSLLHRSLVEHVVAREVAAGRLRFILLKKLSPVLITGVTRMLLADPQCSFAVRCEVVSHMIIVERAACGLDFAQQMLADEERRAAGRVTEDVAALSSIISTAFSNCGDSRRARDFAERALRVSEALHEQAGDADTKRRRALTLAAAHANLGSSYEDHNSYAAAQQHLERGIELGERHSQDAVEIARWRENLAKVFAARGDHARALQEYERCLAIFERRLGPNHHQVASCLGNVGLMYVVLGQPARALPLLQRGLDIQLREMPEDHANSANIRAMLGHAHSQLGNKPEARIHLQEAARVFRASGQLARTQQAERDLNALG